MGFLSFPTLTRLRLFPFVVWLEVGDGTAPVDCNGDGYCATGMLSLLEGFRSS